MITRDSQPGLEQEEGGTVKRSHAPLSSSIFHQGNVAGIR